jgi:formylglycine-generating enzyme required for sulfatase activity
MGADEVGTYAIDRSPFGVLDLGGSVTEWVADTIEAGRPDARVLRGGNWSIESFRARAAHRNVNTTPALASIGLRLCRDAPRTP